MQDSLPIVISYIPVAFAFGLNGPVWDSLLSKAFFSPASFMQREPVRHYRDAGSRE